MTVNIDAAYINDHHRTVKRLFDYLEDRGVLHDRLQSESGEHCVLSAIQIRERMTLKLELVDSGLLYEAMKSIRRAAVAFQRLGGHNGQSFDNDQRMFEGALSDFRFVVARQVRDLARAFDITLEDELLKLSRLL